MHAYFIGGPWDLTKKAVQSDAPYHNVAELPEPLATWEAPPDRVPERVSAKVHTYVRMRVARDVVIYVWDRLV